MERKQWAKYYMSHEETSCQRKELPVTRRNLMWQEETSYHRKKPLTTGRNFLWHEEAFKDWHTNGWSQCWGRDRDCWKCYFALKCFKKSLRMLWTIIGKNSENGDWRLAFCKKARGANDQQKLLIDRFLKEKFKYK